MKSKRCFLVISILASVLITAIMVIEGCDSRKVDFHKEIKTIPNSGENILTLAPTIGDVPDFSEKAQEKIRRMDELCKKGNRTDEETKEWDNLLKIHGGLKESIWEVIAVHECSWYCGGGMYKAETSSTLNANYDGSKANDLDFRTAWIAGGEKMGVGESITYYFKNDGPQVNKINVYNGVVKNDEIWKTYSRVKQLKLYVNEKPFAILSLDDTKAEQSFKIPLLGDLNEGKELTLRFEIMSVYPSDKHQNAALTEIYYDGISH